MLVARALARRIIKALNPDARVVDADFGNVALSEVLDTGLFNFEQAHEHPLWFKELNGFRDHVPETEEYGVTSFVYRARRPFHPARFQAFVGRTWPGLLRAKGMFWLATRPAWAGTFSLAGAICRTEPAGRWWASIDRSQWPRDEEWHGWLRRHWADGWGDRRQELVFIGVGIVEARLREALDACLVGPTNPVDFDESAYRNLDDPFPPWARQ